MRAGLLQRPRRAGPRSARNSSSGRTAGTVCTAPVTMTILPVRSRWRLYPEDFRCWSTNIEARVPLEPGEGNSAGAI